ncbi:Uncharacterized membrane protein [Pseudarcicella hirudinis]|uniref:Uncharacterized membrane protein n=1 Tax=Pseudarcicella hirudinis TaxID=1079859 RepID=A0A1I5M0K2_9BACT|nr:heparan-alpha-glucosaminide N-acetyltransferase domain-containing protein [Pseudarcicella hirudinis]SFP02953.1 Uncharacterized membrane protein [Pseudarcicella hirudinis]
MKRINSIDFVRGLVMVIMALDHVRDLMHVSSITQDPTDLSTTTPLLFMTRWITHLCAPTFVFLSGTSAYLSLKNHGNLKASQSFLLSRGLWLIFLEFTVVNFGIWFDLHFRVVLLQVIAAIGFGFVMLSFLQKLSIKTLTIIGLIITFGHNLLQFVSFNGNPVVNFLGSYFFRSNAFQVTPQFTLVTGYPVIPWLGIMLLGFAAGKIFELPEADRKKILWQTSAGCLILFFAIRFINLYGDPAPWAVQKSLTFTFLSFINVSKYPPSLQYSLVTLGLMFLILFLAEGWKGKFIEIIKVYGKVPLFYYLIHWYLAHSIMLIMVFAQGFQAKDLIFGAFGFGRPKEGFGFELPVVYLIWLGIVISLYPLCKWYGKYKMQHRDNKLLRYL